jgi:hypothetical protein
MSMTQGEAVFQAVVAVFGTDGKLDAAVPETKTWSDETKQKVHAIVFAAFKSGSVAKNSGGTDDAALLKYIPGLVNNWVRKDLRMNGGVKYAPKNPGSRTGTQDEAIKNMKILLSVTTDPEAKLAIEAEIAKRVEELKPKVTVDVSKLPESLRHLIPQS